jgi:hypothetical protein
MLETTTSPPELVSAVDEVVVGVVDVVVLDVDALVVVLVAFVVVVVAFELDVVGVDELGDAVVLAVVVTVVVVPGPVTVVDGAVPELSGDSQAVSATRLQRARWQVRRFTVITPSIARFTAMRHVPRPRDAGHSGRGWLFRQGSAEDCSLVGSRVMA